MFVERYIIDSWAEYVRLRSRMTIARPQAAGGGRALPACRRADPRVAAAGRESCRDAGAGRDERTAPHAQSRADAIRREARPLQRSRQQRAQLVARPAPERSAHSGIPASARYSLDVRNARSRLGDRNLARDLGIALAAGHHVHVDIVSLVLRPIGMRLDRTEAQEIGRQRPEVRRRRADSELARELNAFGTRKLAADEVARRFGIEGLVQRYGAGPLPTVDVVFAFALARRHEPGASSLALLVGDLERELGLRGLVRNRRRSPRPSMPSAASSNCHTS